MVGSSQTDLPSVTDPRTWESTHCILSPIRPHGLSQILMGIDWEVLEPWLAIQDRVIEVLRRYGLLEGEAVPEPDFPAEPVSALPALAQECDAAEGSDPFMGSAEEVTAGETRAKAELFAWADNVLGLDEAELELNHV